MEQQEAGQQPPRRLVGIDLGIASRHSVRVLEADGTVVCRSSCVPTVESLAGVERAALAGAPERTTLAVVSGAGRAGVDADRGVLRPARARCLPGVAGEGRGPAPVPAAARQVQRDRRRGTGPDATGRPRRAAAARAAQPGSGSAGPAGPGLRAATEAASKHKVQIKDLVRQLMPVTPLTGDIGKAGLAVLERYADPRLLLAAGDGELTRLITTASGYQQGSQRAGQWHAAAAAAAELHGDHPAVPHAELAAEVSTEIRLLRAIQEELATHATAREQHYRQADPGQLARSLPGFAEISAPVLVASMGRPGRFRDGTRFKSYVGLKSGRPDQSTRPLITATAQVSGHLHESRTGPSRPARAAAWDHFGTTRRTLPSDGRSARPRPP